MRRQGMSWKAPLILDRAGLTGRAALRAAIILGLACQGCRLELQTGQPIPASSPAEMSAGSVPSGGSVSSPANVPVPQANNPTSQTNNPTPQANPTPTQSPIFSGNPAPTRSPSSFGSPIPTKTPAPTAVNGACGPANNSVVESSPSFGLCSQGSPSVVSGSGPFSWSCLGNNGGTNATCAATLAVSGVCGSANGQAFSSAPTSNLCQVGTPSTVTNSGAGTFDWSCIGSSSLSGTSVSCSATENTSVCSGQSPATVTLTVPSNPSGSWFDPNVNGGNLVNLPHPSTTAISCTACHLSCTGQPNTIIGYDHSVPAMVCNYCHDPSTRIVATSVRTGSMKNYHSSTDSQVCTCCHRSSNNANFNLPAEPATPIIPATQCGGTWPLVYPTWDPTTQAFTGGQFFGGN